MQRLVVIDKAFTYIDARVYNPYIAMHIPHTSRPLPERVGVLPPKGGQCSGKIDIPTAP